MPDTPAAIDLAQALQSTRAYHQRTKHHLSGYAKGPETLDWDAQPSPWRRWLGAELVDLPLVGGPGSLPEPDIPWRDWAAARPAQPVNRASLGLLLELSLALAAWKESGPDRWSVRINPSSGNLHPTEGWLILQGQRDLALPDGVYHYAPHEHALERRAAYAPTDLPQAPEAPEAPRAWVALSSIHWREAWKYGERAFRYCQLDAGHATGALRVAAALLGWRLQPLALPPAQLAALLGLDRDEDFGPAEREDADLLFALLPAADLSGPASLPPARSATWFGHANRLDRHPMYRWPVIAQVAQASQHGAPGAVPQAASTALTAPTAPTSASTLPAAQVVRQRRSAQRFDARARIDTAQLWPLLAALDAALPPFDAAPAAQAGVHVLLFAHRVDGLPSGAYLLPRGQGALDRLCQRLPAALDWAAVSPAPVPLWRLADNPALAGTLRTLNCHQALGSDAVLAIALLAEWDDWASPDGQPSPAHYRLRLQEAGLIGQVLYLEAEAAGLAGTGIGCFFDDALHQLIGLDQTPGGLQAEQGARLQSVYHFTIGLRVTDARIASTPPYGHLPAPRLAHA